MCAAVLCAVAAIVTARQVVPVLATTSWEGRIGGVFFVVLFAGVAVVAAVIALTQPH